MIDCSRAKTFLKEWKRLCRSYEDCTTCELDNCELNNAISGVSCNDFVLQNPQKAIELVQRWSNEHPQRTLLTEFLKNYPNAKMNDDGFPSDIVPCSLGLIERKDICKNRCLYFYDNGRPCYDCWNTPIKESEE